MSWKKILLVDDNDQLRDAYRFELEALGCEVTAAESGEEAMRIVRKEKFDAVFSDYQMPNGDGLWLLAQIIKEKISVPVIIVSASTEINRMKVLQAGGFDYIPKLNGIEIIDRYRDILRKVA